MSWLRHVPARVPAHYPDGHFVIISIKRPGKMIAAVKHPHLKDECVVSSTRQENWIPSLSDFFLILYVLIHLSRRVFANGLLAVLISFSSTYILPG